MTRAAVSYGTSGVLEIVDVAIGDVRDHDVLVRFKASGICHTDSSLTTGDMPAPVPIIPGHEGAGIVERVGAAVKGIQKGDHVAFTGLVSCGRCPACQDGVPNLCEWGLPTALSCRHPDGGLRTRDLKGRELHQWVCLGTLAEAAIVPEHCVIVIPKDVPFDVAAVICCGVLTGVGAVLNRAHTAPGDNVAVFGCGGVGLNVLQATKLTGASTIIAVDPSASKRELAVRFGATGAVDPSSEDVVERIRALTGGRGAKFAFECAGSPAVVETAWKALAPNGTLVTLGAPAAGTTINIPTEDLWCSEKTLKCSLYGSGNPRSDIPRLIELYRRGQLNVADLITARYSLEDVNTAFADLRASKNARGVVMFG
jgi:S-(hydroxymethyl)glutathione dehydrogenase / alcohol dehydrogenase